MDARIGQLIIVLSEHFRTSLQSWMTVEDSDGIVGYALYSITRSQTQIKSNMSCKDFSNYAKRGRKERKLELRWLIKCNNWSVILHFLVNCCHMKTVLSTCLSIA